MLYGCESAEFGGYRVSLKHINRYDIVSIMGTAPDRSGETDTITVSKSDGWYVARDQVTGVASQGENKIEALKNLAEALELHESPVSEEDEPTSEADAPWL